MNNVNMYMHECCYVKNRCTCELQLQVYTSCGQRNRYTTKWIYHQPLCLTYYKHTVVHFEWSAQDYDKLYNVAINEAVYASTSYLRINGVSLNVLLQFFWCGLGKPLEDALPLTEKIQYFLALPCTPDQPGSIHGS